MGYVRSCNEDTGSRKYTIELPDDPLIEKPVLSEVELAKALIEARESGCSGVFEYARVGNV